MPKVYGKWKKSVNIYKNKKGYYVLSKTKKKKHLKSLQKFMNKKTKKKKRSSKQKGGTPRKRIFQERKKREKREQIAKLINIIDESFDKSSEEFYPFVGVLLTEIYYLMFILEKTTNECALDGGLMRKFFVSPDGLNPGKLIQSNSKEIAETITRCRNDKKMLAIPISALGGDHANLLLFNYHTNEVEHFEPHSEKGLSMVQWNSEYKEILADLDKGIQEINKELEDYDDYIYQEPMKILPSYMELNERVPLQEGGASFLSKISSSFTFNKSKPKLTEKLLNRKASKLMGMIKKLSEEKARWAINESYKQKDEEWWINRILKLEEEVKGEMKKRNSEDSELIELEEELLSKLDMLYGDLKEQRSFWIHRILDDFQEIQKKRLSPRDRIDTILKLEKVDNKTVALIEKIKTLRLMKEEQNNNEIKHAKASEWPEESMIKLCNKYDIKEEDSLIKDAISKLNAQKMNMQYYESHHNNNLREFHGIQVKEFKGYCVAFCYFYLLLRLKAPKLEPKVTLDILLKKLKDDEQIKMEKKMTNLIRGQTKLLYEKLQGLVEEYPKISNRDIVILFGDLRDEDIKMGLGGSRRLNVLINEEYPEYSNLLIETNRYATWEIPIEQEIKKIQKIKTLEKLFRYAGKYDIPKRMIDELRMKIPNAKIDEIRMKILPRFNEKLMNEWEKNSKSLSPEQYGMLNYYFNFNHFNFKGTKGYKGIDFYQNTRAQEWLLPNESYFNRFLELNGTLFELADIFTTVDYRYRNFPRNFSPLDFKNTICDQFEDNIKEKEDKAKITKGNWKKFGRLNTKERIFNELSDFYINYWTSHKEKIYDNIKHYNEIYNIVQDDISKKWTKFTT